jgi:hypothetical protein
VSESSDSESKKPETGAWVVPDGGETQGTLKMRTHVNAPKLLLDLGETGLDARLVRHVHADTKGLNLSDLGIAVLN